MTIEHHALVNDLPEHKDTIHALKLGNTHFAKLMEEYHNLTNEVEKLENAGSVVADEAETALKTRRVQLKDELMKMILAEDSKGDACCGGGCH